MKHFPLSRMFQSRYVLGECYKGRSVSERTLLTHLVYMNAREGGETEDIATGCREPIDNVSDCFSNLEENDKRPTCKTCARKWDKLKGNK